MRSCHQKSRSDSASTVSCHLAVHSEAAAAAARVSEPLKTTLQDILFCRFPCFFMNLARWIASKKLLRTTEHSQISLSSWKSHFLHFAVLRLRAKAGFGICPSPTYSFFCLTHFYEYSHFEIPNSNSGGEQIWVFCHLKHINLSRC